MSGNCMYPHCMMGGGSCDREKQCDSEDSVSTNFQELAFAAMASSAEREHLLWIALDKIYQNGPQSYPHEYLEIAKIALIAHRQMTIPKLKTL